jgi:hypothetical protein
VCGRRCLGAGRRHDRHSRRHADRRHWQINQLPDDLQEKIIRYYHSKGVRVIIHISNEHNAVADPTRDINNAKLVDTVIKNGAVIDRGKLDLPVNRRPATQ